MTKEEKREYDKIYFKTYYQKNKDYISYRVKKYNRENKLKISEYGKKIYQKEKDRILSYNTKYRKENRLSILLNYKERLKNDPVFKIKESCRNRVRQACIKDGAYKSDKTFNLIGCTPYELRTHIEKQFTEGMSWNNYGKWEIDHIIPCAVFDLTDPVEQKQCFHFTNLQPLWKADNMSKGARIQH